MFVGLDRGDRAQHALCKGVAQVDHVLGMAQNQAHHDAVASVSGQQFGQTHGLGHTDNNRFFGEYPNPRCKPGFDLLKVKTVGRGDNEKVRARVAEHRIDTVKARGVRANHFKMRRLRVEEPDNLHLGHRFLHDRKNVPGAKSRYLR